MDLKIGDWVTRNIAGSEMELVIIDIDDQYIYAGAWKFCKYTGAEVDEDLNWGPPPQRTGSYIILKSNTHKYN